MTHLDRYLIPRLLAIVFFALLVFTISWLAPETLFKAIEGVNHGKLTVPQALEYLAYQVPEVLIYCLPISMLFGSVFLFRQLSLSAELIAMFASGIALQRLLVPVAAVGITVSLLFFLTQEVLSPIASQRLLALTRATQFDNEEAQIPHVTFVEKHPSGQMAKFLVISPHASGNRNQFIFLLYTGQGDNTHISRMITANRGHWDARQEVWHLGDGIDYWLDDEGIYSRIDSFNRMDVATSPVPQALLSFPSGNPAEFNMVQLARYVQLLQAGQQTEDAKFYRVRLLQRLVQPWVPLLFAVLGAVIGIERSRAKRNLGLTYGALLLLLYNILVPSFTTLGSIGMVPPLLAAVSPLVLAGLIGLGIIRIRKFEG